MLSDCPEFRSQSFQINGYVFHETDGLNQDQTLKTQWLLSNEIYMDTRLQDHGGRDNSKNNLLGLEWEKYQIGYVYLFLEKQGLLLSVHVDDIKIPCGRN